MLLFPERVRASPVLPGGRSGGAPNSGFASARKQEFVSTESSLTATIMLATSLVFLTLIGITASAVFVFGWAARTGQFRDTCAGARSIFDPDEPEGHVTDSFPAAPSRGASQKIATSLS
jgi:nitrogen fixation-related uncharacterized protein